MTVRFDEEFLHVTAASLAGAMDGFTEEVCTSFSLRYITSRSECSRTSSSTVDQPNWMLRDISSVSGHHDELQELQAGKKVLLSSLYAFTMSVRNHWHYRSAVVEESPLAVLLVSCEMVGYQGSPLSG